MINGNTKLPPGAHTGGPAPSIQSGGVDSKPVSSRLPPILRKQQKAPTFILIALFILLTGGISIAGYLYYKNYEKSYRSQAEKELLSVTDLKVNDLAQWRKERLGDASVFYENEVFGRLAARAVGRETDTEARNHIRIWLEKVQSSYQYRNVMFLDTSGRVCVSVFSPNEGICGEIRNHIGQMKSLKGPVFVDFHRESPKGAIALSVLVPVAEKNRFHGVVTFVIDPKVYLFPMIQRWPTPSETAETLLVRRDGSDVQFLNELRFHKNTALQLRFPLSRHDLPAARAALGEEGIVEGKDYRDVSVVAALRAVPDSPWFMVAKIDRKDIYGTIRKRLWLMLLVVTVCIGTTGTGILFFWQREQNRHYSTEINAARELEASEERFRKTFSTSPEAIIIARLSDGTLSSVNPAFSQTMGYQSEEVIGKTVLDLNLCRNYPDWEDMMKQLKAQGAVRNIEILLLKKDGQTLYSLLSGSLVVLEGTTHVLLMARDITDHKTSEQALRDSEELYRNLFRQHAAVKLLIDQDTGNILDANDAAVIFYGWPHERLIRMNLQDINALSQSEVRQEMEKVRAKKRMHFELRHRLADGSFCDVEVLSSLIEVKGRQSILSIIHDISDRKRTEAEIVRLNNELEQKVRERTAELSAKTVELERLNKVFVGRELRMRELKSRIKELEEKT